MPYCFSRSSVKFQGHTTLKIVEFDPNWAFPDCNSSLNSPMAMKCCTKLETAKARCPIVFQGHPSNCKVTRDKTSPILTQIGRFRTIGRSQLSNPSDLPCLCFVKSKSAVVGWEIKGWNYSSVPLYQYSSTSQAPSALLGKLLTYFAQQKDAGRCHWNGKVFILMKCSSLAALEVVKMTTSSAASDENFVKMTTFLFQW